MRAPIASILVLLPGLALAAPEPAIQAMVAQVQEAQVTTTVNDLVAFGTRYSGTAGCEGAADYLRSRLDAAGLSARFDDFTWGATTLHDVVARKTGLVRPDEVYLVLAHFDSLSENPTVSAPGADDDASGVAAVLEIARVLSQHRFEATIDFLLTSGEEQGMLGAEHDAAARRARGEDVAGVINFDMIGYWPTGWGRDVDVAGMPEHQWLVDLYAQVAADYTPTVPVDAMLDWDVCADDQVPYWQRGFPSIIVMDCHESHNGNIDGETVPHYHRTSDLPATLDFFRIAEITRATTGAMAALAVPITRTLLRNDALTSRTGAGLVLRDGDESGSPTCIDPARPGTTARYNPPMETMLAGDGAYVGAGAPGTFVFYETDQPDDIRLRREDANSDGIMDVVVAR